MDRNRWYGRRQSVHIPYKRFFAVNRRIKRETLKASTFFSRLITPRSIYSAVHALKLLVVWKNQNIYSRAVGFRWKSKNIIRCNKRGQKGSENIEGCSCVDGSKQSVLHVRDNRPWSFYFLFPCTLDPPVYISYFFPLDLALHSVVPCHF